MLKFCLKRTFAQLESPYSILGVTAESTPQEIKNAYYKLAKKYHPDVNPSNSEIFKKINQAYSDVSNKTPKLKMPQYRYDPETHGYNFRQNWKGFTKPDEKSEFFGMANKEYRKAKAQQQNQYYYDRMFEKLFVLAVFALLSFKVFLHVQNQHDHEMIQKQEELEEEMRVDGERFKEYEEMTRRRYNTK
ncbi:cbpA_3 [Blepharisma stoltei]|uniref:J domain-containing protein n=1 Tax=Blepharisma stoltei TaxID=1481888 RepID=A0AAU9J062_9CILI|nr:unnamed protein product [Blepharisma stoltei]